MFFDINIKIIYLLLLSISIAANVNNIFVENIILLVFSCYNIIIPI